MINVSRLLSTTIVFLVTLVCFGIFAQQIRAMECATGYEPSPNDTGCIYIGGNAQETDDQYTSVNSVNGGSADSNVNSDSSSSNRNSEAQSSNKNTSSGDKGELSNPLKSKSIEEFILKIIDVLLVFATPIIMLYIMYAGYLFVTARGDSGQISTARSALLWAVVGGVIVLGARVIIAVIQGTIKAF